MDTLFFSRGRGRGHAARDLSIARELRSLDPGLRIAFASYDVGAQVLREAGESVHDLDLPERNPFPATVVRAAQVIDQVRPRLTIAQEEPAVCAASAIHGIPSIFTTHWFPVRQRENTQALEYARRVLFMEEPHIFEEPYQVRGRVQYCGPVLRRFSCAPGASAAMRSHLGLTPGDLFLLVLPGSPSEQREPIFDLVMLSLPLLEKPVKLVVWVAGRDHAQLSERASRRAEAGPEARVIESSTSIDELILASDAVITKGTYNISREVMALGRPAVAISHRYNWVDDLYARRWKNTDWVVAAEMTSAMLAAKLAAAMARAHSYAPSESLLLSPGARTVATAILTELRDL